jgi:hypothetical protein
MNALRLTCLMVACAAIAGCKSMTADSSRTASTSSSSTYGAAPTGSTATTTTAPAATTATRPAATTTTTASDTGGVTTASGTGTAATAPSGSAAPAGATLQLSGTQEVPPVMGSGTGSGSIIVSADGVVSGSIKTAGVEGTAAHIHVGAAGANGPVIIPLTKGEQGTWSVPAGAKLTDDQMKRYKAGELYVNVHTAANPNGEVRAQLKP